MIAASVAAGASLCFQNAANASSSTLLGDIHEACGCAVTQERMRMSAGIAGIEHHERPEYADRSVLLSQGARWMSGFASTAAQSVALAGRIAITVALLAMLNPLLMLMLLPLLAVPALWASRRAKDIDRRAREATAEEGRKDDHLVSLLTTAAPAREVRIGGLADELVQRERDTWADVTRVVARGQLRAGVVRTAGWLVFAVGYFAAVGWVAAGAGRGQATPGDVILVATLAGQVNFQVSQAAQMVVEGATVLRTLQHFLWLQDFAAAPGPLGLPAATVPERLTRGIDLEGVSFRYPGTETDVLRSVDLHLAAGSTVAIVGENGAGKTSIVKLLCRYYEPTAGRITVDGIDVRSFDVGDWRRRLSAGFQDFMRLELTLREAVGVGDLQRIDHAASVDAALVRAEANLALSLETQLGTQWENGVDLSEGQWQKVAIARATMRDEPLLLLLDEPTSGLDAHAEHALFERYSSAAAAAARATGAITVLVSHRFSTVRMADHIVVISGGHVVEQGRHESLMEAGGLYAELYGIQARAYT